MRKLLSEPFFWLAVVVVLIVIFRKQLSSWWNGGLGNADGAPCQTNTGQAGHFKNKICMQDAPAEGSVCNLNGQAGTIVNGACVINEQAARVILVPIGSFFAPNRRRGRCYSKPEGSICEQRIFDPQLGWGRLHSSSNTSCCYIF